MTGREYLDSRKRWVMGVFYCGGALFLGSLIVSGLRRATEHLALHRIAGHGHRELLGMGYGHAFGMRCPSVPWESGTIHPDTRRDVA